MVEDQFLGLAPNHGKARHDCQNVEDREVGLMPYYREAHLNDSPFEEGHLAEWGRVRLGHCCPERLCRASPHLVREEQW
jgi:hypothetical protein